VVEDFHGDLGDVSGTEVGAVGGEPATLFALSGGELIQWSDGGRWYGLFGRGIARSDLVAAALGMRSVAVQTG